MHDQKLTALQPEEKETAKKWDQQEQPTLHDRGANGKEKKKPTKNGGISGRTKLKEREKKGRAATGGWGGGE